MWGVIPAAGLGTRIQPLAFSKELLPVGSRLVDGVERPKAVIEYIVERMLHAGADKLCFVIAPGKADIVRYFGSGIAGAQVCYVVQPDASGLCDAIFRALPLIRGDEHALVGMPDSIWFPEEGFRTLQHPNLDFLLFPVKNPEAFDAVVCGDDDLIKEMQIKQPKPSSHWMWGGFRASGDMLSELHALWVERGRTDVYIGTLMNDYIARGGEAHFVKAGDAYCDVGTVDGHRQALRLLESHARGDTKRAEPIARPANLEIG